MNAFRGIEASTGYDYDAERFGRVFDRLQEDDVACERVGEALADTVPDVIGELSVDGLTPEGEHALLAKLRAAARPIWFAEVDQELEEV